MEAAEQIYHTANGEDGGVEMALLDDEKVLLGTIIGRVSSLEGEVGRLWPALQTSGQKTEVMVSALHERLDKVYARLDKFGLDFAEDARRRDRYVWTGVGIVLILGSLLNIFGPVFARGYFG